MSVIRVLSIYLYVCCQISFLTLFTVSMINVHQLKLNLFKLQSHRPLMTLRQAYEAILNKQT